MMIHGLETFKVWENKKTLLDQYLKSPQLSMNPPTVNREELLQRRFCVIKIVSFSTEHTTYLCLAFQCVGCEMRLKSANTVSYLHFSSR